MPGVRAGAPRAGPQRDQGWTGAGELGRFAPCSSTTTTRTRACGSAIELTSAHRRPRPATYRVRSRGRTTVERVLLAGAARRPRVALPRRAARVDPEPVELLSALKAELGHQGGGARTGTDSGPATLGKRRLRPPIEPDPQTPDHRPRCASSRSSCARPRGRPRSRSGGAGARHTANTAPLPPQGPRARPRDRAARTAAAARRLAPTATARPIRPGGAARRGVARKAAGRKPGGRQAGDASRAGARPDDRGASRPRRRPRPTPPPAPRREQPKPRPRRAARKATAARHGPASVPTGPRRRTSPPRDRPSGPRSRSPPSARRRAPGPRCIWPRRGRATTRWPSTRSSSASRTTKRGRWLAAVRLYESSGRGPSGDPARDGGLTAAGDAGERAGARGRRIAMSPTVVRALTSAFGALSSGASASPSSLRTRPATARTSSHVAVPSRMPMSRSPARV